MKNLFKALLLFAIITSPVCAKTNTYDPNQGTVEFVYEEDMPLIETYAQANVTTKVLSMPSAYDQNDYKSGTAGTCSSSIANSGCSLVAFADVRDYYYKSNRKNPEVINNELKNAGVAACAINFENASNYYGLKVTAHPTKLSYTKSNHLTFAKEVASYIDQKKPIIFHVTAGNGRSQHWMVIYGYKHVIDSDSYYLYVLNTGATELENLMDVFNLWGSKIDEYVVISK